LIFQIHIWFRIAVLRIFLHFKRKKKKKPHTNKNQRQKVRFITSNILLKIDKNTVRHIAQTDTECLCIHRKSSFLEHVTGMDSYDDFISLPLLGQPHHSTLAWSTDFFLDK